MGAIKLYCDLLSMPDVLKPEHRHYAEELSLLSTRSEALIQHLIQLLTQGELTASPRVLARRRRMWIPHLGSERGWLELMLLGAL